MEEKQKPTNRAPFPVRQQEWRDKIRASQLINRLNDHGDGLVEMSPSQIKVAEILLKKVLPDLKQVEHSGGMDININYIDQLAQLEAQARKAREST
jgi:hypothetical protein